MGRLHRPGVAGGGIGDLGHVKAGDHLDHPVQGGGGGNVDFFDKTIGNGAVEHLGHQHGALPHVVGIVRTPGDLVHSVHTGELSAYFHKRASLRYEFHFIIAHRQAKRKSARRRFPLISWGNVL